MVQRDRQKIAGPAFRRKQFDSFAKRSDGGCVFAIVEKQHAQVHVGGGHFGIERGGALVFRLRFF